MKRPERIDRVELMRTFVRIVEAGLFLRQHVSWQQPGNGEPTVAVA